jgi:hypothetical protein
MGPSLSPEFGNLGAIAYWDPNICVGHHSWVDVWGVAARTHIPELEIFVVVVVAVVVMQAEN